MIGVVARQLQRRTASDEPDPDLSPVPDVGSEGDRFSIRRNRGSLLESGKVGQSMNGNGRGWRICPAERSHGKAAQMGHPA